MCLRHLPLFPGCLARIAVPASPLAQSARALLLGVLLLIFLLPQTAAAVEVSWVSVAKPNVCDVQSQGCFGAVTDAFLIGEFEVTNAQYAEFLNAVAESDPTGLYNTAMAGSLGGITRQGTAGSYTYVVNFGRGDNPVNSVSFYDALRFANWLHNGQPTGLGQVAGSTEDGAYLFSGPTSVGPRKPNAKIVLPNEDEWYKAAYYDPGLASYFDYPTATDVQVSCAVPGPTPNTANCGAVVMNTTDVGAYTASESPNGTFDQGGNVREWTEGIVSANRVQRGGDAAGTAGSLSAAARQSGPPTDENTELGFRVAQVRDVPIPVWFFLSPGDDGNGGATLQGPPNPGIRSYAIWADVSAVSGQGLFSMQDVRFQSTGVITVLGFTCAITPCLVGNPPDPNIEFVFTAGDDHAASPGLTGVFKVGDVDLDIGAGVDEVALVGGTALDGNFVGELLEIEGMPNNGILITTFAQPLTQIPAIGPAGLGLLALGLTLAALRCVRTQ